MRFSIADFRLPIGLLALVLLLAGCAALPSVAPKARETKQGAIEAEFARLRREGMLPPVMSLRSLGEYPQIAPIDAEEEEALPRVHVFRFFVEPREMHSEPEPPVEWDFDRL